MFITLLQSFLSLSGTIFWQQHTDAEAICYLPVVFFCRKWKGKKEEGWVNNEKSCTFLIFWVF
jgi:hypothetical protein